MAEYKDYLKIPNRKKYLITKEFCQTFKEELGKIFSYVLKDDRNIYYTASTGGFHKALEKACVKRNVMALLRYAHSLGWWQGDQFDGLLVDRMHELGVIGEYDSKLYSWDDEEEAKQ